MSNLNKDALNNFTSWGVFRMFVGVLGKGSGFCSSDRGRGGVVSKAGVPGASDWSVRVGVAQGEP